MTTNHDALREALELGLDYAREALALHDQMYQRHPSTEAERGLIARHLEQIEEALAASKPKPQAQAGEPEVVAWIHHRDSLLWDDDIADKDGIEDDPGYTPLITLQSHREAIAKKDAALAACVEALEFYSGGSHFTMHDPDAWDTVSGEPQNFYEDENNTATVEDGSIARAAIEQAKEARG